MWDRENPYELQFLPGESCFKPEENPRTTEAKYQKGEIAKLQQAIVEAQKKLKELREKEEGHDTTIKSLKGELHRKNATLTPKGFTVDFGILLDSEDNFQWFKKRAQELVDSFTALQLESPQHIVRIGVVFYNSHKALSGDIRVLQFTDDFQKLTGELPIVPREGRGAGLKGAIGEALNLLQWQGTARLLLHPSPSSSIQKGQDPPFSQNSNFFRFNSSSSSSSSSLSSSSSSLGSGAGGSGLGSGSSLPEVSNVELQRAVYALRAMYIDYFILKTHKKSQHSAEKKSHQGYGKFTVAISRYFDDPDTSLECKFLKIEDTQSIKKAIISCIGMALRS